MLNMIKALIEAKKNEQLDASLIVESVTPDIDDSLILDDFLESDETIEPTIDTNLDEAEDANDIATDTDYSEPVEEIEDTDLLSVEIDLTSNTPVDVLPVPPGSAADAVVDDDIMNQRIDSGFGGEEEQPSMDNPMAAPTETIPDTSDSDDESEIEIDMDQPDEVSDEENAEDTEALEPEESSLMDEEIDDEKSEEEDKSDDEEDEPVKESSDVTDGLDLSGFDITESTDEEDEEIDLFSEAIITDGNESEEGEAESTSEEAAEETPAEEGEESPVTAAVKDKVAEAGTAAGEEVPEDDMNSESSPEEESDQKMTVFKKLTNLTKNVEDIKNEVAELLKN